MALIGHLSDLSLSELIEFFCNQRKSGRLEVLYPRGPGYFYLQSGSVVNAKIGTLRGIDAVYYALTLPNAEFNFQPSTEPTERNINQPWTQVVLEGLRRLDEGIAPAEAYPEVIVVEQLKQEPAQQKAFPNLVPVEDRIQVYAASLASATNNSSVGRKEVMLGGAVAAALVAAALAVPAGLHRWTNSSVAYDGQTNNSVESQPAQVSQSIQTPEAKTSESESVTPDTARPTAKRHKGRVVARATAAAASAPASIAATPPSSAPDTAAKAGPKRVTVQLTYDEAGRVTQASGADPTALRIARQRRFPPGKAGSTTVTIPIN